MSEWRHHPSPAARWKSNRVGVDRTFLCEEPVRRNRIPEAGKALPNQL